MADNSVNQLTRNYEDHRLLDAIVTCARRLGRDVSLKEVIAETRWCGSHTKVYDRIVSLAKRGLIDMKPGRMNWIALKQW